MSTFFDKNGNEIDVNKTYKDVACGVSNIHIIMQNNHYFAKPDRLDAEPLEDVCNDLVVQ